VIGDPSILSVIDKSGAFLRVLSTLFSGWTRTPHDGSGIVHWWIVEDELLKLKKKTVSL
jgi:hypothetical protein